jgi:hypothetical protein
MNATNESARSGAGANVTGLGGEVTKQQNKFHCSEDHIRKLTAEIRSVGLQLRGTSTDTQQVTLPKVFEYLGARGLNTYEAVGLGYLRIATRVKELKDVWEIVTVREDVIGPDQLYHKGVGRYILIGKRKDLPPSQRSLSLEGSA